MNTTKDQPQTTPEAISSTASDDHHAEPVTATVDAIPHHDDDSPIMIDLRNVTKKFGDLTALDSVTLQLRKGDIFGYIGPNGAGKSTTMKILACLMPPTSGHAYVSGYGCHDSGTDIRKRIGYMPDFLGVYPDLKVSEYLDFFAAAYGLRRGTRKKMICDVLELTDLVTKRDALVENLSRGMQQRLGIARVLIHDPEVLLLDEPASGLDPRARIEIRSLLLELRQMGKTIMVSSHILSELHEMCNTIGIIELGKLVYAGSIDDAVRRSGMHGRVEVEVDKVDLAIRILKELPHVDQVQPSDEGTIIITLEDDPKSLGFIPAALVANNVSLESMKSKQTKLEDVFLSLTKGSVS